MKTAFSFRCRSSSSRSTPAEPLNIPDGTTPNAAAECARYDKVIEELGGIDLQLLGIGRNGHIGFNEPGSVFVRGTNCVQLTQSTIDANKRFFLVPLDELFISADGAGAGSQAQDGIRLLEHLSRNEAGGGAAPLPTPWQAPPSRCWTPCATW